MRRLPLLVSVVVAVDTLFFTALTPLIPRFADKYDLSKAGAGALVSAYAAGTLGLSRFFQGVGSSCSWAGGLAWVIGSTPRQRRGELIGTTMGAAVFGAL